MFCYQCEQTAGGKGCTVAGVCGKSGEVAGLLDQLVLACKGISVSAHKARELGRSNKEVDAFIIEALFTTITNVNFDPQRINELLDRADVINQKARLLYAEARVAAGLKEEEREDLLPAAGVDARIAAQGETVAGLQEMLTYGLKGMAAYAWHARILGIEDESVYAFFHEALASLADGNDDADALTAMALKCGEVNLRVMEMLDAANTGAYGHPVPTAVRVSPVKGKAILVSGHDLKDLEELLKQTEGKGINIYTHGEMLPAHGYPELKKYPHLVGNYGGAWQRQREEFDAFPGAILMTTNCIQKPKDSYIARIFTCGLVAWPNVRHIANHDFSPVIEAALAAPGFAGDAPEKNITVGFGRNAVLGAAATVVDLVKQGKIRHFFLVGGCDGAKPGRSYYTELAQAIPQDCLILTLACGKYRFNNLELGNIEGLPRLLDVGQCNDAYSAIRIAAALADAFGTDVNGLPLSLILSWYEQKAVCILLSLLHLGIRKMRLGPTLPAFVSPAVLQVLQEKFELMPVTTPEEDLKAILG